MSGGVDSSVAAHLLKEQGHEVVGLFMQNWEEENNNEEGSECSAEQDYKDAQSVAESLDIPCYYVNFSREYKEKVFDYFVKEYQAGRTPNPDILCNKEVKFDVFYHYAKKIGAEKIATGHYAQIELLDDGSAVLKKGIDESKDQSYFLHAVGEEVFRDVLFPLGAMPKSKVREIAKNLQLKTAHKKDSTGICFIGEKDFSSFLSRYTKEMRGEFQTLAGEKLGKTDELYYYTLGQRKGLGLGGAGEPYYVVGKDIEKKIIYVERGKFHKALYVDDVFVKDFFWINKNYSFSDKTQLKAKLRYRQEEQECLVEIISSHEMKLTFLVPQRAASPGQFAVLYSGDICLGGGVIDRIGSTYHEMKKELPESVSIGTAK